MNVLLSLLLNLRKNRSATVGIRCQIAKYKYRSDNARKLAKFNENHPIKPG